MRDEPTWSLRVSGISKDRVSVFARRSRFEIGVPLSFDEEYQHLTALEHFLAAVGSDLVSGLIIRAKRLRVEIDNVEATVECTLDNPLAFLDVVGEEGGPGVKLLRAIVYISSLAEPSEVEELWQATLLRSPLVQTPKGCCRVGTELQGCSLVARRIAL